MFDPDSIDKRILAELRRDGRLTISDLAEIVGLSPTPCARRVRKLEQAGIIRGYHADISPENLGKQICVLISVKLAKHNPDGHAVFQQTVKQSSEVSECLMVTGAADYILKAWFPDIEDLRLFITTTVQNLPEVAETSTMLVVGQTDTGFEMM